MSTRHVRVKVEDLSRLDIVAADIAKRRGIIGRVSRAEAVEQLLDLYEHRDAIEYLVQVRREVNGEIKK